MRGWLSVAVSLVACRNEVPPTKTVYFAERRETVEKKLAAIKDVYYLRAALDADPSAPPETAGRLRIRTTLFGHGPMDILIRGDAYTPTSVCEIQIGPVEIRRPLSPDFIFDLVDDPALGHRMRDAVGPVPLRRFYNLGAFVDGVQISVRQYELGGLRPIVLFRMDGCNRTTPRYQNRHQMDVGDRPIFEDEAP